MTSHNQAPTLAELFVNDLTKVSDMIQQVNLELDALCRKYQLRMRSPLLKNGVHIGVRYIFADTSFADFYFEAQNKVFTGIGSPAINDERTQ